MKFLFPLTLFFILITGKLYSQTCCGDLNSITIIPSSPTTIDTIKIVTKTTAPSLGYQVSYIFNQRADTLNLGGCFFLGGYAALQTYLDTTKIGILKAGTYYVNYLVKLTRSQTECSVVTSYSLNTSFQVMQVTGFENNKLDKTGFSIYPNPSDNELYVQNDSLRPTQFTLYNSLGNKVIDKMLMNELNTISLSAFSNGMYFYQLNNDKQQIKSGKIIKQ